MKASRNSSEGSAEDPHAEFLRCYIEIKLFMVRRSVMVLLTETIGRAIATMSVPT